MMRRIFVVSLTVLAGFVPGVVSAATLSLSPSVVTIPVGETVTMSVLLDPEDDRVNTVQGEIHFSTAALELLSVSTADSTIVYWGRSPTAESPGRVTFLGGVPNPGVSGSRANVFDLTVRGRSEGTQAVTIESAVILADDGLGSDVLTSVSNAAVIVQPVTAGTPDDPTDATDTPAVTGLDNDSLPRIMSFPSKANLLEELQVAGTAYGGDRVEIKLGTETAGVLELPDVDGARARLGILTPMNWSTKVTAPLRGGAYEVKIDSIAPDGTRRSSAVQTLNVNSAQIVVGASTLPTLVFVPSLAAVILALIVGNVLVVTRLFASLQKSRHVFQRIDRDLIALRARVDDHVTTTAELDRMIDNIESEIPHRRRPAESLPRE